MLPLEVTCDDLKTRLDSGETIELVDCREPAEHEIVRLEGARLAPMATIPSLVAELADSKGPLIVYCHHGMRSAQTATWLRENGVPQAQSLAGGIDQWAEQVDPSLARY